MFSFNIVMLYYVIDSRISLSLSLDLCIVVSCCHPITQALHVSIDS